MSKFLIFGANERGLQQLLTLWGKAFSSFNSVQSKHIVAALGNETEALYNVVAQAAAQCKGNVYVSVKPTRTLYIRDGQWDEEALEPSVDLAIPMGPCFTVWQDEGVFRCRLRYEYEREKYVTFWELYSNLKEKYQLGSEGDDLAERRAQCLSEEGVFPQQSWLD